MTDEAEQGLRGLEVRLWAGAPGVKGLRIHQQAASDGAGFWRLDGVPAGSYQLDVRGAPGEAMNWGDRWYDREEPFAAGWIQSDADWIEVVDGGEVARLDVVMLVYGGLDGRVVAPAEGDAPGAALPGVVVRAEVAGDCRIHHNDETDTGADSEGFRLGRWSFRGLTPGPARLLFWDLSGQRELVVVEPPFPIEPDPTGLAAPELADVVLPPLPPDPHEPNDRPSEPAAEISDAPFRQVPPGSFTSAPGARVAPRGGGDLDWFCLYAAPGDRFVATATATRPGQEPGGGPCASHPFIDPTVSWWVLDPDTGAPAFLVSDDDSGPGTFDALADTGLLAAGGRLCALVSTFGDVAWDGQGRQSHGPYTLAIAMGNRPPALVLRRQGEPVPPQGATVEVSEGGAFCLDVEAADPDGDALALSLLLTDRDGGPAPPGSVRLAPDPASPPHAPQARWCWTVGAQAGDLGPYRLAVSAADADFAAKADVRLVVPSANEPPPAPVLVNPPDGAHLDDPAVALVVEDVDDPDGDPVKYRFEVHYDGIDAGDAGAPDLAGDATPGDGGAPGLTAWTPPSPLLDDRRACWRARADDGRPGGLSPWSEVWCFLLDAENSPPRTPEWAKPGDVTTSPVRRPALAVWSTEDPEGDPVEIEFAYARAAGPGASADFSLATTGRVPQRAGAPTTAWRAPEDLDWGGLYAARARAHDDRGGASAWTPVHVFAIKDNLLPTPALWTDTNLGKACGQGRLARLPDRIVVPAPFDPEGEVVTVEVQVLRDGQEDPVLEVTVDVPPGAGAVEVPMSGVVWEEGGVYTLRTRTGDPALRGPWVECALWIDAVSAPAERFAFVRPEEGERLPLQGARAIPALVTNPIWADAALPGRRGLRLLWRLVQTPGFAAVGGGAVDLPRDGGGTFGFDVPMPAAVGLYRLSGCVVDAAEPAECLGLASVGFEVFDAAAQGQVGDGSSCDCGVAAPDPGLRPAAALRSVLRR